MEALYSMRGDAEVEPKCLSRSLVIRKKKHSLERALEAKERGRRRRESSESTASGHGGVRDHLIITDQCP